MLLENDQVGIEGRNELQNCCENFVVIKIFRAPGLSATELLGK